MILQMTPADWAKLQAAFDSPKEARSPEGVVTMMDIAYKPVRCDTLSIYAKAVVPLHSIMGDYHLYKVH